MAKRYINVTYQDRDIAKKLGARWDASVKRWYYLNGSELAKIYQWRTAPKAAPQSPATTHPAQTPQDSFHDQSFGSLFG